MSPQRVFEPIRIIGIGGLGNRIVQRLMTNFGFAVQAIYIDSDASALAQFPADRAIKLGDIGEGADLDFDATCVHVEELRKRIREAIKGASIVFTVAALGGTTGTTTAPLVARMAEEMGILTMTSIVYRDSNTDERVVSNVSQAMLAFRKLKGSFVPVRWFDQKTDVDPLTTYAFRQMELGLRNFVSAIADMLIYGFHCTDIEDLRYVMERPGKARLGVGIAYGKHRVKHALAEATISIGTGFPLKEAGSIFVVVTSGTEKSCINEQRHMLDLLRSQLREDALILHGWNCDRSLEDKLRITLLATGGPGRLIGI